MNINHKDFYAPPEVIESYKRYKKRDFSKLVIAADKPSNLEAEEAIVHNIGDKVADLLEKNNAHIRVGVCYNAPLQNNRPNDKELVRVTAMVSAFNKKGENLGNIEHPLYIIYDFVKYQSDPTLWNLNNFSQNIPFDYVLNNDRLKSIKRD